jgi:hypothetical protein
MVVLTIQLPLGYAPRYWLPICGLLSLLCVLNMSRILARFTWTRGFQVLGLVVVSIGLTLNLQTYVRSHDRFNAKGPWRELAEFFEMAREHPLSTTGVLTPNCHAFQLITGKPAPMPLQRIDPHYDHLVARMDGSGVQPPPGSRLLWTRDPWAMFELPRRMALADLIDVEKYAPRNGLYVEPYDPTIRELPEP